MSLTIKQGTNAVSVVFDGAADLEGTTSLTSYPGTGRIRIKSITFVPSAAGDKVIVRDGAITGVQFCYMLCLANDSKTTYYEGGIEVNPYVDWSECTMNTVGSCMLIFHLA